MFCPRQLWVGTPGGREAAIHSAHRYLQTLATDHIMVKLDFENAFNSLHRSDMLLSISERLPELYAYCMSSYKQPSVCTLDHMSSCLRKVHSRETPQSASFLQLHSSTTDLFELRSHSRLPWWPHLGRQWADSHVGHSQCDGDWRQSGSLLQSEQMWGYITSRLGFLWSSPSVLHRSQSQRGCPHRGATVPRVSTGQAMGRLLHGVEPCSG